jgi:drug/metabolite transporter (DMT)-like permease
MHLSERLRADLTLFTITVLWGSAFAVLRVAAGHGIVFILNGTRFFLAAIMYLPFVSLKDAYNRENIPVVCLVGSFLFIGAALQQAGLMFTTAGNAGFITSLYVVFVPIIMWVGWREPPFLLLWVAIPLAVFGGYLLSTGGAFKFMFGDLLVLAGSVFWGFHVVLIGRYTRSIPTLPFAIGQFVVAGILNLGLGLLVERPSQADLLAIIPAILYTGIFSIGVGFTLQMAAQKHTPPADAALILSLEAVFAALFGWLMLGEKLLPIQILGCALILIAVILVQGRELKFMRGVSPHV